MLYGKRPFGDDKSQQSILSERIMLNAKEVIFPDKPNNRVSAECKVTFFYLILQEFIRKCLAYNTEDRFDVYEAYNHPFIRCGK